MPSELRISRSDSRQSAPGGSVADSLTLATARWCASHGWSVHLLTPGRKAPAGKCPRCREGGHSHHKRDWQAAGRWCHGFRAATLDRARIDQWLSHTPVPGIGIACGPAGLVVVDVHVHQQPLPVRDQILPGIPIAEAADLRGLPNGYLAVAALRGVVTSADNESTLRVWTSSEGLHVCYGATDGRRWRCSAGSSAGRPPAWQVDVRASGCISAPGTTTSVGRYIPLGATWELAPLLAWLAQKLERTGQLPRPSVPTPRPIPPQIHQAASAAGGGASRGDSTLATVLGEVAACSAVVEGAGFSDKLSRAVSPVGGLFATGHPAQQAAVQRLQEIADSDRPRQMCRIEQIIHSGMNAGMQQPSDPRSRS